MLRILLGMPRQMICTYIFIYTEYIFLDSVEVPGDIRMIPMLGCILGATCRVPRHALQSFTFSCKELIASSQCSSCNYEYYVSSMIVYVFVSCIAIAHPARTARSARLQHALSIFQYCIVVETSRGSFPPPRRVVVVVVCFLEVRTHVACVNIIYRTRS